MRKTAFDKVEDAIRALQKGGQTLENRKEFWESVTDYWSEDAVKNLRRKRRTHNDPDQETE